MSIAVERCRANRAAGRAHVDMDARGYRSTGRRAFSAIEVVVSIVILAFAILPVMNMMTSGRKYAALSEFHLLAQLRARRIVESYSTYPYERLLSKAREDGGNLELPFAEPDGAMPDEYRKKLERYDELCFFDELEPGLGVLTVKISWTVSGKSRKYVLKRIVYDEGLSLADSYPLRQQGARLIK